MKKQNKGTVAAFCFGLFMVIITPIFAAVQHLSPLPTEQRYQFINQVKDGVDLPSAGEIVKQSYDRNEGVLSPSSFRAEVAGEKTFEILKNRIIQTPGVRNCIEVKTQLTCRNGQVDIFLASYSTEPKVEFILTDSSSGRTSK